MHPHQHTDTVAPLRPKNPDAITVYLPETAPVLNDKALDALLALLADTHTRFQARIAREKVAS